MDLSFLLFLGGHLFLLWRLFEAFSSLRVDIRCNIYHGLLFFNFALRLADICFLESRIYLVNLCLPQVSKTFSYLFPHDFVQLNDTLCANLTHVLKSMLYTDYCKLQTAIIILLVNRTVTVPEYPSECLVFPNDLLVSIHSFFRVCTGLWYLLVNRLS